MAHHRAYIEAVGKLYARSCGNKHVVYKSQLSLDRPLLLAKYLNNPQNKYHSIHITGTNGKGSVSTKLANVLTPLGNRVGLMTSPHISCIRERIRINNELISEQDFADRLDNLLNIENVINILQKDENKESETFEASFFELMTMLGFDYFAQMKCNFAVIEVGLGGKWDATNILKDPLLTVITSISYDHTSSLGNSIEEITYQKAGIIKKNRPVVIGPTVPYDIIRQVAEPLNAPIHRVMYENENGNENNKDKEKEKEYSCFDDENTAIAKLCLKIIEKECYSLPLTYDMDTNDYASNILGWLRAKPICRMETKMINQSEFDNISMMYDKRKERKLKRENMGQNDDKIMNDDDSDNEDEIQDNSNLSISGNICDPPCIERKDNNCWKVICVLDAAHNTAGMKSFFKSLTNAYPTDKYDYRMVVGMSRGKNIEECMKMIAEKVKDIHLVSAENQRAIPIETLKQELIKQCNNHGYQCNIYSNTNDIETQTFEALTMARKNNQLRLKNENENENEIGKNEKEQILIVTGSLYIMKYARRVLGWIEPFDNFDVSDLEFKHFNP